MKPVLIAASILLLLTLGLSLLGSLLARRRMIRVRNAKNYARLSVLLVVAGFYMLTLSPWPGLHLRALDFWSATLIVAITSYVLVLWPLTMQLNKVKRPQYDESVMLSMLASDDEHPPESEFAATQVLPKNHH